MGARGPARGATVVGRTGARVPQVERHPAGWELGTVEIELTDEGKSDPLFADVPGRFRVHTTHEDQVVAPPPGATVLARNDHSPFQALAVGDSVRTVQFHPEVDEPIARDFVDRRRHLVDRPPVVVAAWAAAAALVAAALLLVWRAAPSSRGGEGSAMASSRTELDIEGRAVAVAEAGADLSWRVAPDGDTDVRQTRGSVFYRVSTGGAFEVHTPGGRVNVTGTCFTVEILPMRTWMKNHAAGLAVGAAVGAAGPVGPARALGGGPGGRA